MTHLEWPETKYGSCQKHIFCTFGPSMDIFFGNSLFISFLIKMTFYWGIDVLFPFDMNLKIASYFDWAQKRFGGMILFSPWLL